MSGVVVACTPEVSILAVGDDVFGVIRFDRLGAAGEFVTAPAEDLAHRSRRIPHGHDAALLAGPTAWQALHDHAALRPDERVLVHVDAGGVGAFAVQLAHQAGAIVTATVRGANDAGTARRLGARDGIDVSMTAFDAEPGEIRRRDPHRQRGDSGTLLPGAAARRPVGDHIGATVGRAGAQYQADIPNGKSAEKSPTYLMAAVDVAASYRAYHLRTPAESVKSSETAGQVAVS